MVLTSPLMLLGLLALPALAAIYWLRSRSQRAVVSSLVFWIDPNRPRQGGRILHRMQTPLTLFLELLAVAMLVLAAAGPALVKRDVVRPLMVVLDDSYSMQARTDLQSTEAVRDRAQVKVAEELDGNAYAARFIVAGVQPQLLGHSLHDSSRLNEVLTPWTCQSPSTDLSAALALAAEVGGPTARILVLTDHAPPMSLDSGQIEWRAFGSKQPNMAFTAATRSLAGDLERVLIEVAQLSDTPGRSTLTLNGGNLVSARTSPIELDGGASRQFVMNLPAGSPALRARLDGDALAIDNEVFLLASSTTPLRVLIDLPDDLSNKGFRHAIVRALEATGQTLNVTERPELVISDTTGSLEGDAWRWEILGSKEGPAYTGPFVIDRNHTLTQGLSLQNAIWAAPPEWKSDGAWLVAAGNVPLITDRTDTAGRHRLQMGFVADQSNLLDTPDWPILVANVVQWRHGGLPGLTTPSVRLGETVSLTLAKEMKELEVVLPTKDVVKVDVHGRQVALTAAQVGLHTIRAADTEYRFACNAISRDESDLSNCQTGRWGSWNESPEFQDRRISLAWVCLLVALTALAAHLAIVTRNTGGTGT